MKQIEAFVDSVYQKIGGNKKEIQELKAEMKSHLLEAVHELKTEGKSEQEAIDVAINRFGGEKEIRSVVGQLFKAQKTFANWILFSSIAFLVIASTIFGTFLWHGSENMHEQSHIATEILNILEGKDIVSQDIKKEVENLVQGTDHISKVQIYNVKDVEDVFSFVDYAKPNYEYSRALWVPKQLFVEVYPIYGNGYDEWYVNMETRSHDKLTFLVLFAGVSIYWTLFSIWAIINSYHQKRLNIGWTLAFILFNVLGYLIYFLAGKKKIYE